MNINNILNREDIFNEIKNNLDNFEKNKNNLSILRGIYIYGKTGVGKTYFIKELLNSINYDYIIYDSSYIRNKQFIESISKNYNSNLNVLSMLQKKSKKKVIIIDEIDIMNIGDKNGITALIKIIRPKKTKKQKNEEYNNIPIICIGNHLI